MSESEWSALKAGDVVIDGYAMDRERKVFKVSRHSGKPSQGGKTRVCLTVSNLKSHGSKTHIFVSDAIGQHRFRLKEPAC